MNAKHAPATRAEARALRAATRDAARPWYPTQRVLRSIFGALVVLVPLVNGTAAATIAYLTEQQHVAVPSAVFVWLNALVAITALVIGLASRIMAVPGVNAFLISIGLGTVPKDAIEAEPIAKDLANVYVKTDPKI